MSSKKTSPAKPASKKQTPLMRQYFDIKEAHPETILLFRVGDFYETFSDDAHLVSRELGITLTKRNNGGDQTALAGFPYHALETYLPKLVKRGYRVAVCEQTENPEAAKKAGRKIVEREVTEITTPGVTLSEKLLDHKRNNYLAALHLKGKRAGIAFCDISTGEFALSEVSESELPALLQSLSPAELLLNRESKRSISPELARWNVSWIEEWVFEEGYGYRELTTHFGTHSLKGFGVEEMSMAQVAAGALLHYMQQTQKSSLNHLRRLQAYEHTDYMALDGSTKRNLELTASIQQGGDEGTLVSILDFTQTAMGGRLLRKWVMRPLKKLEQIVKRLDAVRSLYSAQALREQLREELKQMGDLERLISRISVGRTSARDLLQLADSLGRVPGIAEQIEEIDDPLLQRIHAELHPVDELRTTIKEALVEEPPASTRDGGMFREGYNDELDELRDIARNGKAYIARIKDELSRETGISSLKIGYNKVFGYYIEVTNTHKEKVPEHFIRKQTLVNSERYITPELKEVEEKVLSAEERSQLLEAELFETLREETAGYAEEIQELSAALAELDCLQGFAEASYRHNYVRPDVTEEDRIDIRQGRHPVVERTLPPDEPFIPNDILLDNEQQQILIITGPNMAGKSIILRQAGLIVLMAQIGCFVPASEAEIGIVDKIFTRVGASDNLAAGESTFLVEMNEAANILNNATPDSLVLLDEVGRGTSTFDGLSIAWSLAEYLHNQKEVAAKTLFATHYHELNELESLYERIKNYNVQVREHGGKVIFMRKLVRGGADHSYGIQVADMAGLPAAVIDRAREILTSLESHTLEISGRSDGAAASEEVLSADRAAEPAEPETDGQSAAGTQRTGSSQSADTNGRRADAAIRQGATKRDAAREVAGSVDRQPERSQMSLFKMEMSPHLEMLLEKLRAADPDRMTPLDAMNLLAEIKRLADEE